MPPKAAGEPAAMPLFFYDFASPDAYLAAERIHHVLPAVAEWVPVRASGLPAGALDAWRCEEERAAYREDVARLARARGLQPLVWPPDWPGDWDLALRVATYAKAIGRAVAFSLAAFRQAYAAGRDLRVPENVLIAAAACEMHPAAVLKGAELRATGEKLAAATAQAAGLGVTAVPALAADGEVFAGDAGLEAAADVLRRRVRRAHTG